ncbi:DUF6449 domain-containing protein [Halobacillus salinus]|uniref:DUF6449 domain-containing protein n=1 Tax=Halobacillus salinus TaxID=192814 RepID=A0A4Z0GZ80_9BACI|nr:DUF6449 domain-containing protein [Halobacillus salinus]TGB01994.1 hypothetical protein E4663_15295 [Halobacillus salinus]
MPSRTFLLKKEWMKQDFRNVGWISIVYFVALAFLVPLQVAMKVDDTARLMPVDQGLFSSMFSYEFQVILLFLMPVLMSVFLMRYMHVKSSSDFMHSLPIRREKLFNQRVVSGIVLVLAPVLLNSLLLLLFYIATDVSYFYSLTELGYWTLLMVIISLLVFMSGVFVGTLTGLSAVQGVLTYILLFFPAGIYLIVGFNVSLMVSGFSADYFAEQGVNNLSPLMDLFNFSPAMQNQTEPPSDYGMLLIYLVAAIIFYILALFTYKKRALETAAQALSVSWLKPIFTFGVSFCTALAFGVYFAETAFSFTWLIFGYVLGGSIGFLLSTMLLEKTWRIWHKQTAKRFSIYAGAVAIVLLVAPLAMLPSENYVPNRSEVESVYLGNHYFGYEEYQRTERDVLMTSDDAIEKTIALHESLIDESRPLSEGGRNQFIMYRLNNGKEVYRQYQVANQKVEKELAAVMETEAYKELTYPIMQLTSEMVGKSGLIIEPRLVTVSNVKLTESEDVSQFLESVKEDLYNLTYEEMNETKGQPSYVNILNDPNPYDNNSISYGLSIDQSYAQTISWLKERELYDDAFLEADDIDRIEFYRWEDGYNHPDEAWSTIQDQEGVDKLSVSDVPKIEKALQSEQEWQNIKYLMAIIPNNETEPRLLGISEAPAYVNDHFNE